MKTFNEGFDALNVGLAHHFSSGVYAKETRIPAGTKLVQHVHKFDHLSILASGTVRLFVDGEKRTLMGPKAIMIEAGKSHEVEAITDAVWFCIHATDETDPQKVDHEVTE